MKRFIFLILTILTLTGCGLSPEQTVDSFLKNVKENNIDKAVELSYNPDFVKNLKHNQSNEMQKIFFEALNHNFSYKIINSAAQPDKTIVVNVELENIDVQDLLFKVFQKSIKKAFAGNFNINVEEAILEVLKEGNISKTKTVDQFIIKKVRGKYKVDVSSKNIDNIYGTYYSSISNISNIGR